MIVVCTGYARNKGERAFSDIIRPFVRSQKERRQIFMNPVFYVLIAIAAIIALLILTVLLRAASVKPTAAKEAKMPPADRERSLSYANTLSEMIKVETISDRDNYDLSKYYRYHEKLRELFPLVFSKLEITDIDGNLLAKWKGKSSDSAVLLMSHQDVVSAEGEWEHDPFGGEIIGDKIWGRGTLDTKSSAFAFLCAAEELLKEGYVPETDIYLAGSCTEEISGDGAGKTVEELKRRGVKLSLVLDEGGAVVEEPIGGVSGLYAMVGVVEKGYCDLKFIAKGHGGHASIPPKNSPWARLAAFINEVEKHDPFYPKFNDTTLEMFRRLVPNMPFAYRIIFANMWLFKPLMTKLIGKISDTGGAMIKTTMAFTKGKGSEGYNVLPLESYVTANLRFINHQPTGEGIEMLRRIAKKYDIDVEVITALEPSVPISYSSNAFKLIEEAAAEIFPGLDVVPYVMTGGTDAKDYERICDNVLRLAPVYMTNEQRDSIHAENENLFIDALPPAVDFFKYIIRNSAKAKD